MYNKVKKALNSMAYDFVTSGQAELRNNVKVGVGFIIKKSSKCYLYVETCDNGDIKVYNTSTGKCLYLIKKAEVYIMMFQLASVINN